MDQVELKSCIKALKMPLVLEHFAEYAENAAKEGWSFEQYLYELLVIEREARNERRFCTRRQSPTPAALLPLQKRRTYPDLRFDPYKGRSGRPRSSIPSLPSDLE